MILLLWILQIRCWFTFLHTLIVLVLIVVFVVVLVLSVIDGTGEVKVVLSLRWLTWFCLQICAMFGSGLEFDVVSKSSQ